jgi:hypothetical protein
MIIGWKNRTIFYPVEFRGTAEQFLDLLFNNANHRRMTARQLKTLIREYGDLRVKESKANASTRTTFRHCLAKDGNA